MQSFGDRSEGLNTDSHPDVGEWHFPHSFPPSSLFLPTSFTPLSLFCLPLPSSFLILSLLLYFPIPSLRRPLLPSLLLPYSFPFPLPLPSLFCLLLAPSFYPSSFPIPSLLLLLPFLLLLHILFLIRPSSFPTLPPPFPPPFPPSFPPPIPSLLSPPPPFSNSPPPSLLIPSSLTYHIYCEYCTGTPRTAVLRVIHDQETSG